ncbi:hypothetical protein [Ammonifex thiophilus]|uniref:Uncharacterized protein n=1 Tax=Ammonifex thiophilus TaxID=444093 RepID=A0A3D8P6Q9_9THEO|nr:hypothetical protein [Ammonifex thiophilus]RDV83918.1 hypothetical protein DXX99_03525 [Ammonifex thiophilus]
MFLDRTVEVRDVTPAKHSFADMAEKTPREALVEEVLEATGLALFDTLAKAWPRAKKGKKGVLKLIRCGVLGTCKVEAGGQEFTACFAKQVPEHAAESLAAAQFFVLAKLALRQANLRPVPPGLFPFPAWELGYPGRDGKEYCVYLVPVSFGTETLLPAVEEDLKERKVPAVFVVNRLPWRVFQGFGLYRLALEGKLFALTRLELYLPDGRKDTAHPFGVRAETGVADEAAAK